MTSHGSSDFDIKFSGHVPILWKRKVRNFIKKDRQQALEIFLENYKEEKDPKQMQYGLEQLLPESLDSVLSSFKELTKEETVTIFNLLSSPEFLTHISSLNQEKQELILNQIYKNWIPDLKQESIEEILSQINPTLSTMLYNKILDTKFSHIVEILQLWGTEILPIILDSYLETPIDQIEQLFKDLEPEKRVEVFQRAKGLSKEHLQNVFPLMSPTEEELGFLFTLKYLSDNKSRNLIINWLTKHKFPLELLLRVYKQNSTDETLSFMVTYFVSSIKQKVHPPDEVLLSILSVYEFPIAHEILEYLNSIKEYQPLEILVSCLSKLQGEVSQYLEFFQPEFETYSSQNIELILQTYLLSPHRSHHQLLLPFLQDVAAKNWKKVLKATSKTEIHLPAALVFNIFQNCSKRTKNSIGNYLIEESLVKHFSFLFSDYDIFQSALVYSKELPTSVQVLLDPFLRQHVSESFKHIIRLGKKITFPQLAFSPMMDETSLKLLLSTIGKNAELITFWEETFLLCSEHALQVVLQKYIAKERRKKDYLVPLLEKLIDLETLKFWTTLKTMDLQEISRLEPILTHTFEKSIPIIGEVLPRLPKNHLTFIINNILPQFSSSGAKILYSLFSINDISNIEEQVILTVLKTVQLDHKDLLTISLVRCSKLITNPKYNSLFPDLLDKLFTLYPTESLAITDIHRLSTLVPPAKSLLSSLSKNDLEETLSALTKTLASNVLKTVIHDGFLHLSREGEDLSLLEKLLSNYETEEFSIEGTNALRDYLSVIVGKSGSRDLLIFTTFRNKPQGQVQFLPSFFSRTSHNTLEKILIDSPVDPLEENMLRSITNYFESNPPENPEEYFLSLYKRMKEKEDVQRAILPLLGEFCSWHNLSILMELQEREKYPREYQKALIKFSSRFDIQSPQALQQIWISGLKEVYTRLKKPGPHFQSQCPQCGNPILEKQKNCGFCSQRLTCIICRKSVVLLQSDEEVVQCPQCANFFHRRHLQESVKLQKKCPVCNVTLREREVSSLPAFTFFYK
ncbi:MAG: E3 ubiquitin protein ligase [Candidatus Heimdallarchaeota archaeon]|nr:MAG: E3 ubiquitin protein ligase [Candidatus Heimdallarchaeota archaeon]